MDVKHGFDIPLHCYVVSNAGAREVIGVYKNLDGNSNDGTWNYKMKDAMGRIFKLYRSPSEDHTLRYWIIEERNKDYFYLSISGDETPPEQEWTAYVSGKGRPPLVTKVSGDLAYELQTRLENQDSFSTLDLINQYGHECTTDALKRLYRVLWETMAPEKRRASEIAKKQAKHAKMSSRNKKKKLRTIQKKITINVQLVDVSYHVEAVPTFQLTITFDTSVQRLIDKIADHLDLDPTKILELMVNGHKILSREARINNLGIGRDSTIIALGVEELHQTKSGDIEEISKSALHQIAELENASKYIEPYASIQLPRPKRDAASCAIQ